MVHLLIISLHISWKELTTGQDYNYIQLIEQNVAIRWLHAFLHLLVMLSDVADGMTGKHIALPTTSSVTTRNGEHKLYVQTYSVMSHWKQYLISNSFLSFCIALKHTELHRSKWNILSFIQWKALSFFGKHFQSASVCHEAVMFDIKIQLGPLLFVCFCATTYTIVAVWSLGSLQYLWQCVSNGAGTVSLAS